jgi:hypothetical protein
MFSTGSKTDTKGPLEPVLKWVSLLVTPSASTVAFPMWGHVMAQYTGCGGHRGRGRCRRGEKQIKQIAVPLHVCPAFLPFRAIAKP